MSRGPRIEATSITVMAPDPHALADFYAALLGVPVVDRDPTWAQLRTEHLTINVEREEEWREPVWPARRGEHASTQHLDLRVDDLAAAAAWAERCGAQRALVQPQPDDVVVMLDPAGHPFCLFA